MNQPISYEDDDYPPEYAWSSDRARTFHKPRDFDEQGSLSACGNVTLWAFTTHREIVPAHLNPCPQPRCFGAAPVAKAVM